MPAQKIFINYSSDPEDVKIFQNLYLHLGIIRDFEIWHAGKIMPGSDWQTEVEQRFAESEVILPLLSVNYLNDEACMKQFDEARQKEKKLYPLLAGSFDLESFDDLKGYGQNIIPEDKSFLESSANLDVACTQITRQLRNKLLGKKAGSIPQTNSRKFLYLLTAIPIICGIGFGLMGGSEIALPGSMLIISISLLPIAKLLWPTNTLNQY